MLQNLRDFWYDNGDWITIVGFVVLITVGLLAACNGVFHKGCADTAAILQLPYKYSFYINCLVNVPEYGWVELDEYQKMVLVRR